MDRIKAGINKLMEDEGKYLAGKRIFVIGAGTAGLTFVAALNELLDLQIDRPRVIVVEREPRTFAIAQNNYINTIRGVAEEDGMPILKKLDLFDEIAPFATETSGTTRYYDEEFKELHTKTVRRLEGMPVAALKVAREELMRILVRRAEGAKNTHFFYNSTFTSATKQESGGYHVSVNMISPTGEESQREFECDMIIAADGPQSAVYDTFLSDDQKKTYEKYSGVNHYGGISYFADGLPPHLSEDYRIQLSSGRGVACVYTPFDDHFIGWILSVKGPEGATKDDFSLAQFNEMKAEALKIGYMFSQTFRTVVKATDIDSAYIKPTFERQPFGFDSMIIDRRGRVEHDGIFFVGDAGHFTNDFERIGADLALQDAYNCAKSVAKSKSVEEATRNYDLKSARTFKEASQRSADKFRLAHATGVMWTMYKASMAASTTFETFGLR